MSESQPSSPPSKRVKLEPSPSPSPQLLQDTVHTGANDDADSMEEEHCTICLQSFIDRTIIPTCAHEFCFECILLWSEQSRKCPLCSGSFDNSYLIHRIRSQYDYQKHHLPPSRTSPPLLTNDSRARALRNTRRERQWGRRERRRREEADQLERAISRRRWIYQHNLYAKHIASNPHTRYRPFPTPAQLAASPDLISRMTIFLRRELRVWPNLDVEFLTTYTISLMKSIDIRSESAVKLLSEFLDLDTPYIEGARHANAEHFAHEIYSYLRSPYRDLNTYDQIAQYDSPSEIPQPQETERGRRWGGEIPPRSGSPLSSYRRSRSRSNSRYRSPIPQCENRYSPPAGHSINTSADKVRPSRRHRRSRSPLNITRLGHRDGDPRHHISTQHSHHGGQDHLRNNSSSCPETSSSVAQVEDQVTRLPTPLHFLEDKKGKGKATVNSEEFVPAASTTSGLQSEDSAASAAVSSSHSAGIICPAVEALGVSVRTDESADHVDELGSSANSVSSRKCSRFGDTFVRPPRNRTLSESIQAHLSRPTRHITESKQRSTLSGDSHSAHPPDTTGKPPSNPLTLLRHSHTPTEPDVVNLNSSRPAPHDDTVPNSDSYLHPSEFLGRSSSTTVIKLDERSGGLNARPTRFALPSYRDASPSVDRNPGHPEFPPSNVSTAGAPHAPAHDDGSGSSSSSSATQSSESIQTQTNDNPRGPRPHTEEIPAFDKKHTGRPGNRDMTPSADDRRFLLLRRLEEAQRRATTLGRQRTDTSGSGEPENSDVQAPFSDVSRGACEDAAQDSRGLRDGGEVAGVDVIEPSGTSTPSSVDVLGDVSDLDLDLESRLRTRALVRVRLAEMKGTARESSDTGIDHSHDEASWAGESASLPISGEREAALRDLLRERERRA